MSTVPTFPDDSAVHQADLRWWITTRPLFYGYQTTQQTGVASSTWTATSLQTALVDRDTGHVGTSGRYTIGLTLGWYTVAGQVAFTGAGGTTRAARLVKNGAVVPGSLIQVPAVGSVSVVIPPTLVESTDAADWVELQCYHDAGAPLDLGMNAGFQSAMLVEFAGT